ncbi:Stk1 family PASTA domain-containing Ser/Thr kinase [Paenibacillus koleovorans]|uniref:Stk1 family PASTA domain-containing Ser/Thr kinase n=1 Tax=Paenibacillus koleovorans TaxID=121608 RepID=UPI00159C535C|nr:Stk1 family PASTA domain-containing Ser/Thr kinase [Paenibacillus koleovorans]
MIGHVLGGRYEIMDRIGGGGMALVYKGHDILLNRKVAVKVLRQQYVHDEEFIRRFRREAQAAASLSHPNVVSIYDVGQEEEVHYIVMEYVEGKTLNEVIKERAPMQVEDAIRIASQICDALDHAHHNQIIHRDIKPHNILMGKNGRVKVTDFGIARAADSSQITQTGSVVGSVHYFSPEHAKGTSTGAKSDIYSLGIVLYQMLTARLPFSGESPISVALKHLQENVEEPRKVNPLIPQSVENMILKSMRKNQDERYQSAREMLKDLETCLLPERRNEPKIVFASDAEDQERTRVLPALKGDAAGKPSASAMGSRSGDPDAPEKKKRLWLKPSIWGLVIVLFLLGMWYAVGVVRGLIEVPETEIPNVVNMNVKDAQKLIEDNQLKSKVITQPNKDVAKDIVFAQNPEPMRVKVNNEVVLYVSLGTEKPKMPDWSGKSFNEIINTELVKLGIAASQVTKELEVFGVEEPGTVLKQVPAPNEEYDPKTVAIKLTISKGREQFSMPNLSGMTETEASSAVVLLDLKPLIERAPTYKQQKGKVFDQFPFKFNDLVSKGQEIKIFVSNGYPPEAKERTVSRPISPAVKGKESTIRIVYSDARGDNIEWASRKITDTQTFDVVLVLSPEKDGTIQYFVDGARIDLQTVPYNDKATGSPSPTPTPTPTPTKTPGGSASPTPTPTPKPSTTPTPSPTGTGGH